MPGGAHAQSASSHPCSVPPEDVSKMPSLKLAELFSELVTSSVVAAAAARPVVAVVAAHAQFSARKFC